MLSLLGNLSFSKYLIIGMGGLTAALGGMYLYGRVQIANLENSLQARDVKIQELVQEVAIQQRYMELQLDLQKILDRRITEERKNAVELQERLKEIEDAPESHDGPVADVIRDSIKRLPNN